MGKAVCVVGVGNPNRGDDGIGPVVAARIAAMASPDVDVVVSTADPSRLLERWGEADTVVLVDALVDDAAAGTIEVFDAAVDQLPPDPSSLSSHGMGIPGAVDLARALGRLPARVVVVGVVGQEFVGNRLTSEVEGAIDAAVSAVMEVVSHA